MRGSRMSAWSGFNGAGDGDRRRGRTSSFVGTWSSPCFNGAGDGDRRRAADPSGAHVARELASTEPAMVIAGGSSSRRASSRRRRCFNGAGDGDRRRVPAVCQTKSPGARFNGAGDGDRRRAVERLNRLQLPSLASTEPAMVIAGGSSSRAARRLTGRLGFNGAGDGDRRRALRRHTIAP